MKNVRLPEQVTKTYYNCFEQQIMTLAYYYHGEFWKLFMNQHLEFQKINVENIEDTLKYINFLVENAKRYYGVQFEKEENIYNLNFESSEIYLGYVDTKMYPFTEDLDERGIHCLLIYGLEQRGYIVNDNYYGVTDFVWEKARFEQGIKKLYLVKYNGQKDKGDNSFKDFCNGLLCFSGKAFLESYNYIKNKKIKSYKSAELIDLINEISCFVNRNAMMVEIWSGEDRYLKKCASMIMTLANKIRKVFYAILKAHLKYEIIPPNLLYQKLEDILNILECEEKIKQEVIKILLNEECIKNKLYGQILKYLKVTEIDEDTSVYDVHDKLSIMYLINYLEKKNDLKELEYDDFTECETYIDFELKIYEKIFYKEWNLS